MTFAHRLWYDTETYSEEPIKNGTHKYAAHAEVMLVTYAFGDGPVQLFDCTLYPHKDSEYPPLPINLLSALEDPNTQIVAHNAGFDRLVTKYSLGVDIPRERWYDTAIQARMHALPGGLDALCEILGLGADKAKHKAGKALIQLFCKPRPKNSKVRRATRETHPAEWEEFEAYAMSDIAAMREVHKKMPRWNYDLNQNEFGLWLLDQEINDRGFCVDVELAQAALRAVDVEQARLRADISASTGGAVPSATQRDVLLAHILQEYGVSLPDMQKSTLERRLEDPDIPEPVKELLRIRLSASTSSTSKYKTLLRSVSADGRLRGTLQFAGAGRTSRWSGRLFQPQNLPRPKLKNHVIEAGIESLKLDCAELVVPDIMELTSSAIRGCIIAPPGRKLVVSDLSNIEGRAQAWLAGESWKLQAFRDYDAGTGHDLYKLAYAKAFQIKPEDVTKDQRQIGKVLELSMGYEGGVGAFVSFAAIYGIDLDSLTRLAYDTLPDDIRREAEGLYKWLTERKISTFGLDVKTWVLCDSFKRMWRYAHPHIAAYWKQLQAGAIDAVQLPTGQTFTVGRLKFRRDGSWLRMGLPSGRSLCYPQPKYEADTKELSFTGMNQYSRKWERIKTHGGKLFENACQAVGRDVMAYNMPDARAEGYSIVLTVHDELVTEAQDSPAYYVDGLSRILATNKPWSQGMPLAAAGYEAYRYKKD